MDDGTLNGWGWGFGAASRFFCQGKLLICFGSLWRHTDRGSVDAVSFAPPEGAHWERPIVFAVVRTQPVCIAVGGRPPLLARNAMGGGRLRAAWARIDRRVGAVAAASSTYAIEECHFGLWNVRVNHCHDGSKTHGLEAFLADTLGSKPTSAAKRRGSKPTKQRGGNSKQRFGPQWMRGRLDWIGTRFDQIGLD